ncbi:hypothetical protein EV646_102381 [Kribbella antiqua]|uniref:Uncharacterized protein n=1 Tax=Kribbella antiqua TaxID=2512217 RepID=A0A4R2IY82_9ACTN|nr:hypothetical protein EV646_102381 [Kribbella antiqua]
MVRRWGAVHGDRESGQVVEVGLDELLGWARVQDDSELDADEEYREDEPDPVAAEDGIGYEADESTSVDADLGVSDTAELAASEQLGVSDEWREDLAGASLGAAFVGWLVAGGTAVLLLALAAAVGSLIGWDKLADWSGIGWVYVGAWIVLVLSMGIGAFAGGYTSGRLAPSQGGREGLAVWTVSWDAVGLIAGVGYLVDRKHDLVARIDWPSLPIAEADRALAAAAALVAILLVTLVGAILGGWAATNHR